MPFVDKYDTQSAIELMRQSVDYHGWFDKVSPVLRLVAWLLIIGNMAEHHNAAGRQAVAHRADVQSVWLIIMA